MPQAVLWLRRDLRLADNPALQALLDEGYTPVPLYIDHQADDDWPRGAASAWWLHHSLTALQQSLRARGSDLLLLRGAPETVLPALLKQAGCHRIAWNRCYEPGTVRRDQQVARALQNAGCSASSHSAALLRDPEQHLKKDGTPYRVFTPFWNSLYAAGPARQATAAVERLPPCNFDKMPRSVSIDALGLLPKVAWDAAFHNHWRPGEEGAWAALRDFQHQLPDYPQCRDRPADACTSQLSPHLHFGEISPVQVWEHLMNAAATTVAPGTLAATESYLREIAWREFSHHLLYHYPSTPLQPLDDRFRKFPWRKKYRSDMQRWQRGQTGIPLVDAGMRELWETGYMHNRVRMIVASFLTKNLLIPWQEGARWFWDTLVDADLANNTMGWQWVAGCGADAAPYFRVFNPVLQGEKFDEHGDYVRRWVPELARLDKHHIHKPWTASPATLADAGITLGTNYPQPLVDLQESRRRALGAWERIKTLDKG